jgi:hypothetical protein
MANKPDPFCLKPEDKLTPIVISYWINRAIARGVNKAKIDKATEHLAAVSEWQHANPDKVKVPD